MNKKPMQFSANFKNNIEHKTKFCAVAFDLDGTLYPNYRFYTQLIPFLLKEAKYLRAFGKARDRIRRESEEQREERKEKREKRTSSLITYHLSLLPPTCSFYQRQAHYMAEILGKDPAFLEERTEKIIYRGWEPLFKKVRLFPYVKEILGAFREKGLKLGLLSDFPPEAKIDCLGLSGYLDVLLSSERTGRLKPDPLPFLELSRVLDLSPEDILYVGNSYSYDILGAQRAGMKAAWIIPRRKYHHAKKKEKADFVFYDYRQLLDFVLF